MMKQLFTLLIALFTLCSVAFSANYHVTLYSADATPVGGIATSSPSPQILGTGSWQNNQAASKMELYLPLTALGSFTIDDIVSLKFSTQKTTPIPASPDLDFFWSIYTMPYTGGFATWYGQKLTSEPMYYNGYVSLYNAWSTYQTGGTSNQMTFFDSNHSPIGYNNAPTLVDIQAGLVNFNYTAPYWTSGTGIDYGAQTVKYISIATGGAWNSAMLSYLDNIIITLTNGNTLTIDLENGYPNPITTIQAPISLSCGTYDVPVTVKDFSAIGAISLNLNYDPLVFDYQGVTLNPAIATATYQNLSGVFTLGQFISPEPVTLPDNAVLFTLHLNLKPAISGAATNFTWSTVSGQCEYAGPGGTPTYVSSFVDRSWPIPVRPVKNTDTGLEYCTIQAAIDAASAGNTITVAAGTYAENLTINKSLIILGPNAASDGCGSRIAEAIIVPATNSPADWSSQLVLLTASNITIKGLTFDGDNPLLNGAGDYNVSQGIVGSTGQANIVIENNILKNMTSAAVYLCDDATTSSTSGNIINKNKIDNISPTAGFGIGVYTGNNTYVDITNNCMTNVRKGIQGGENNHKANAGNISPVWSGNTIQSYKIGIWNNLAYSLATPVTITGNTVTTVSGSTINSGIEISSIQGTSSVNVYGNTVTGAMAGINLWSNTTTGPLAIGANTFIDCSYGVFANNYDGYSSNANSSSYIINGGTITNPLLAAVYVKDNLLNSNGATVAVNIAGTSISGTASGMKAFLVEGGSASLSFSGAQPQATIVGAPKYIVLQSNTLDVPAGNIDATLVMLDTKYGSTMDLPTLFAAEDRIDHKIDNAALGFVTVKANNDYVTVNSFVAPNTTPLIQRGIDVASTGWTVNVAEGTYNKVVNINKANLTLKGIGPNKPLIIPDGTDAPQTDGRRVGIYINEVDGVTIDNFEVDGTNSTILQYGIYGFNTYSTTVKNCKVHDIGAIDNSTGIGILYFGYDHDIKNAIIDDNIVYNTGRQGIIVNAMNETPFNWLLNDNNKIRNNTVHDCWKTGNNGASVQIIGALNSEISGNTVYNTFNRNMTYGISIMGSAGINNSITGNILYNNDRAIFIESIYNSVLWGSNAAASPRIVSNSIIGSIYNLNNANNLLLDASCNWWGTNTVSGVSSLISGLVNYTPWLIDGTDMGNPGFVPGGSCSGATDLFVNDGTLNVNDIYTTAIGNDANPGTHSAPFLTIGKAVSTAVAGTKIWVDAGTFQEQISVGKTVDITGVDRTKTIVKAPTTLFGFINANGTSYAIIYANGNTNTINIDKILVDGDNGRPDATFTGVHYFAANGAFTNSRITAIRNNPFSGVQGGTAFTANHQWDISVLQTVTVDNNIIDDYQKAGIVINELNTQGIITNNTVTGQNIPLVTGQNGIQLAYGAYGTITGNIVTNNIWNKVEHPHVWTASGILLVGVGIDYHNAATGKLTVVDGNNLNGNEVGLFVAGDNTFGYTSNAGLTINPNTFSNNKIHVSMNSPSIVPSAPVSYDKRVDNPDQTNIVFGCIQYAIDEASTGNTLNASAGTFIENVNVHTAVSILGPNAAINPNTGARGPEAYVKPAATDVSNGIVFIVQKSNTIIKGFTIDGDNPGLSGGTNVFGIDVNARGGICNGLFNGPYSQVDNLRFENNIFKDFISDGIYIENSFGANYSWNYLVNNQFDKMREGVQTYALHADISGNFMTHVNRGISIHGTNTACDDGFVPKINNNDITLSWQWVHPSLSGNRAIGIWVNYRRQNAADLIVNTNIIRFPEAISGGISAWGIYSITMDDNRKVTYTGNSVIGAGNCNIGYYTSAVSSPNVKVTGGSLSGIKDYGVLATTNDPVWGAGDASVTLDNVNISVAAGGIGVKAYMDPAASSNVAVVNVTNNCDITGGTTGILAEGVHASVSVTNNVTTITGNQVGILIKNGGNLLSCNNNTITNNTVGGIIIESTAGTIGIISDNTISGNGPAPHGLGVSNAKSSSVNAINNWWGDATGPYNDPNNTCGLGNAVSAKVDFKPWYQYASMTTFYTLPLPLLSSCTSPITLDQHAERDPYATGTPTVTTCYGPYSLTYDDNRSGLTSCNATGTIIRTWTVKDYFDNTTTCVQNIVIQDNDNPVVTCPSNIVTYTDPGLCTAVETFNPTATDFGFFQGFENPNWVAGLAANNPSVDWNEYSSPIVRVTSGTDGITSKSGSAHAVINSTANINPNTTGAFGRLGGYNGTFGLGFISKVDVYFNMSDGRISTGTYGWDLDQAVSSSSAGFLRDFVYHVGGDNTGIYVCASNNSNNVIPAMSPAYIQTQPHATITATGWYTMEWEARDNAGFLAMDFNIRNASGAIVWTTTINTTDAIAGVGGNRYMWFNFIAADKLAIDNTSLLRKLSVTASPVSETVFDIGSTPVNVTSLDACGKTGTCSFTVTVETVSIAGAITYYNTANTPMNNVTVNLKQGGATKYTAVANGFGGYSFSGVCNGNYDVVFSTSKPAGGINSTDAAQVNAWSVGPQYSIEKVRFFAGDVVRDGNILPLDAQRIVQYFVSGGALAFNPDWTYWKTNDPTTTNAGTYALTLNVTGPLTQNFYALATGDFNRSFIPGGAKSASDNLELNINGSIQAEKGIEFELPVYASAAMDVTAVSMILNVPSDKLEVTGIYLGANLASPLDYAATGDELRIGWQSLSPVSLNPGEKLLTLKLRLKVELGEGESIRFSLAGNELNELADADYDVIPNAVLFTNAIGSALGVDVLPGFGTLTFANYPNPFRNQTTFAYSLPVDGFVSIEICNMLGSKLKTLVNEMQTAGDHTLTLDANIMGPGVYIATLRLNAKGQQFNRLIKIIRNQD